MPRKRPEAPCGKLFLELRYFLGLSRRELAVMLRTTPDVVAALETGDAASLPPWPETVRIVTDLTAPMQIDPRPVLKILGEQWGLPPAAAIEVAQKIRRAQVTASGAPRKSFVQSCRRWLTDTDVRPWLTLVMASPRALSRQQLTIGACVAALLALSQTPLSPWLVNGVSHVFSSAVRGAGEAIENNLAPREGGLRWVVVDDPRSRRRDKLPVTDQ